MLRQLVFSQGMEGEGFFRPIQAPVSSFTKK